MRTRETVQLVNDDSLKSLVELNQKLICVGDKLFTPCFDTYIVTEIFEGGFTGKCDWEESDFFFSELQIGWCIAESTMDKHRIEDKFEYIERID